jgi:hypothetical protein
MIGQRAYFLLGRNRKSDRLQMATDDSMQHLRELKVALHQPDLRRDLIRLDELLHESLPNSAVRP